MAKADVAGFRMDVMVKIQQLEKKILDEMMVEHAIKSTSARIAIVQKQMDDLKVEMARLEGDVARHQDEKANAQAAVTQLQDSIAEAGMNVDQCVTIARQRAEMLISAIASETAGHELPAVALSTEPRQRRRRRTRAEIEADRLAQAGGAPASSESEADEREEADEVPDTHVATTAHAAEPVKVVEPAHVEPVHVAQTEVAPEAPKAAPVVKPAPVAAENQAPVAAEPASPPKVKPVVHEGVAAETQESSFDDLIDNMF
jgi:ribonuclease E